MTTSFEGSAIFHASPEKILNLINNFELYKEFLPGCIESSRLPCDEDGFVITSGKEKRLNMPSDFTLENKGGLKNVLFLESKIFGLISAKKDNCFYSKIFNFTDNKSFLNFDCLPDKANTDYNGLGSSAVYYNNELICVLEINVLLVNVRHVEKYIQITFPDM